MSKKTFNISSQLYPEDMIHQGIDDFQWYNIIYDNSILVIDDPDAERVFDEFMNYILSIFSEHTVWV